MQNNLYKTNYSTQKIGDKYSLTWNNRTVQLGLNNPKLFTKSDLLAEIRFRLSYIKIYAPASEKQNIQNKIDNLEVNL